MLDNVLYFVPACPLDEAIFVMLYKIEFVFMCH
jgi:hypothetical protein